jgi:hypothetical protein
MTLPAHTLEADPANPCVMNVVDAVHGVVGSYAWNTATGPGAFMARCVGGWTIERVKQAVEAVYKAGAK